MHKFFTSCIRTYKLLLHKTLRRHEWWMPQSAPFLKWYRSCEPKLGNIKASSYIHPQLESCTDLLHFLLHGALAPILHSGPLMLPLPLLFTLWAAVFLEKLIRSTFPIRRWLQQSLIHFELATLRASWYTSSVAVHRRLRLRLNNYRWMCVSRVIRDDHTAIIIHFYTCKHVIVVALHVSHGSYIAMARQTSTLFYHFRNGRLSESEDRAAWLTGRTHD